jgi:hypothetical protein
LIEQPCQEVDWHLCFEGLKGLGICSCKHCYARH